MPKKFKLYPRTILTAICGVAFFATINSFSSNVNEQKNEDNTSQETN